MTINLTIISTIKSFFNYFFFTIIIIIIIIIDISPNCTPLTLRIENKK
jgi:hypothetical protein